MIKGKRSPLKSKEFIALPTRAKIAKFSKIRPQETKEALSPKNTGVRKTNTAILALQGIKGVRKIVRRRALFSSIIREPKTAGTLHPKPRKRGRKDFPCSPIQCMNLSIT
jgi:hypothetical protein